MPNTTSSSPDTTSSSPIPTGNYLYDIIGISFKLLFSKKGYSKFFRKNKLTEKIFSEEKYEKLQNSNREGDKIKETLNFIKMIYEVEKYIEVMICITILIIILLSVVGFISFKNKKNFLKNIYCLQFQKNPTIRIICTILFYLSFILIIVFLIYFIKFMGVKNSKPENVINYLKIDNNIDLTDETKFYLKIDRGFSIRAIGITVIYSLFIAFLYFSLVNILDKKIGCPSEKKTFSINPVKKKKEM
jgi:hypothetical protein